MPPADRPLPILVVDDDRATREFLVLLLNMDAYSTLEAATGAAALATLAAHPMQAVLLDLRLPDFDGLAVCRQLRASGAQDLPVILITADHTPDLERQAEAAGVTALLRKPFLPEALEACLAGVGVQSGSDGAAAE